MPRLIEKPVGMSREDFDRLPPIISRKVFMFATGLDEDAFYIFVEQGKIRRLPVGRTGTRNSYYKSDAATLAGYTKENKNGN